MAAYTGPRKPKLEDISLADLKWQQLPEFNHIWITSDKHPLLKDNEFHMITMNGGNKAIYFSNQTTWLNHINRQSGHTVNTNFTNLFHSLYKLLKMEYYDTEEKIS